MPEFQSVTWEQVEAQRQRALAAEDEAEGLKAAVLRVALEANAEIDRVKRLLDDTVHALYEATNALTVIEQTRGLAHPLTPPDMIERQNAAMAELRRLIAQGRAALAKVEAR